jgi:hypothetical protein
MSLGVSSNCRLFGGVDDGDSTCSLVMQLSSSIILEAEYNTEFNIVFQGNGRVNTFPEVGLPNCTSTGFLHYLGCARACVIVFTANAWLCLLGLHLV